MDPNKFYCQNEIPNIISTCAPTHEYSPSEPSCQMTVSYNIGPIAKNTSVKKFVNSEKASGLTYIGSDCNKANTNSTYGVSKYIIPSSLNTLQYQHKFTLQENQYRSYYTTDDTSCHDSVDPNCGEQFSSLANPPLQSSIHHHHHHHHHQHQLTHYPQQPYHQQISYQQNSQQHSTSQNKPYNSTLYISHNHNFEHQNASGTTNSVIDSIPETISCNISATAKRMENTNTAINENKNAAVTLAVGKVSGLSPIVYTVHRVVTTSKIQTTTGDSNNASNICSAAIEGHILPGNAPTSLLIASNSTLLPTNETSSCIITNSEVINGPVPSPSYDTTCIISNGNYLSQSKTCGTLNSSDIGTVQSTTNESYGSSDSNERIPSIPKPLQNVIPTCVYLMSRIAVHMEIEGTAQCPSQVMLAAALGCDELGIANKLLAQSIFGLWMTSALLEIQLKSHHRPYVVRVAWPKLLEKFCVSSATERKYDEPMIVLRRNVFFSKRDEEKIKDHRILELLYEEAKHNVLSGRYVMEPVHLLMLGGIQARIELGVFNCHVHTISFFREHLLRFLPQHIAKSSTWLWLSVSLKNSPEVRLLEQFKRVPQTATTKKLMRKYLEFCWALPFYGAAFFHGQIEQPVHGIISMFDHKDVEVLIAVNERGVFIVDPYDCTLLLGLRYEDLSWDFAKPSNSDDPECLMCIFLQFDAIEKGTQVSKLTQVFSKQAPMIDALVSHFADQMRKNKTENSLPDQNKDEPNLIQNNGKGVLCNKLSRLTLATFDEEGRCIGQMGSLSISY